MRIERVLADAAFLILLLVVAWDVCVFLGAFQGHSITHEIRGSWRSWGFFLLAGTVAGGHFLTGK